MHTWTEYDCIAKASQGGLDLNKLIVGFLFKHTLRIAQMNEVLL